MHSFFETKSEQSNKKTDSNLNEKNNQSEKKPLAVISGAGIAGLAASIELASLDYEVIVIEKRPSFTRSNVINLDVDVQRFFKKHTLLDQFESEVAAKIQTHKVIHFSKKGQQTLDSIDVSDDAPSKQIDEVSDDITQLDEMFKRNGFYSASIKDIQNFLAKKAIQRGVEIRYQTQINKINESDEGVVSSLTFINSDEELKPELFIIAEGAHSKKEKDELKIHHEEIVTECTGENWGFGNVDYNAEDTFVVSALDTSKNNVQISNVIFNGKAKIINTAVTVEPSIQPENIKTEVSNVLQKVLIHEELEQLEKLESLNTLEVLNRLELLEQRNQLILVESFSHLKEFTYVKTAIEQLIASLQQLIMDVPDIKDVSKKPVEIKNLKRNVFFKGNTLYIGDSAGSSSPLAGLGGTLALTLYPIIIEKLVAHINDSSTNLNETLNAYLGATVDAWINKAKGVKQGIACLASSDLTTAANETQPEQNTMVGRP